MLYKGCIFRIQPKHMNATEFIAGVEASRRELLTSLHQVITAADEKVEVSVASMMGHQMIQYKTKGFFKYALASLKDHMSLHLMPIYMSPALYLKYQRLLPNAKFQKSCINFKSAEELPLDIAKKLLEDCAKVDMAAIMEQFQKKAGARKAKRPA